MCSYLGRSAVDLTYSTNNPCWRCRWRSALSCNSFYLPMYSESIHLHCSKQFMFTFTVFHAARQACSGFEHEWVIIPSLLACNLHSPGRDDCIKQYTPSYSHFCYEKWYITVTIIPAEPSLPTFTAWLVAWLPFESISSFVAKWLCGEACL